MVFTSDYGETTGTDDRYYEITIENGTVTAVGGNDSDIPEAGFVLAARGENYKTILTEVAVGDCVILDTDSRRFGIIGDDYDPFYSAVISFDGYNRIRNADTIIIYDTGDTTGTNIWGTEVCVDSDGFICSIGGNNNVIPEGGFVISAVGAGRIAELTDAAGIGLRATADAEKKTITFSYSAESIRASLRITLEGLKERYAEAANTYSIIDYKTAEELIDRLEKLYELVCDRLDDGDIGPAIGAQYSFESLTKDASLALTESPAVEGRAMWLRPSGLTTVEAVSNTVAEIKSLGYNIICLELLYDSTFICPMPEDGYFIQNPSLGGFDLLGAFIDECASQGIELQGWLSVYRVSYDTSTYYSELAGKIAVEGFAGDPQLLTQIADGDIFIFLAEQKPQKPLLQLPLAEDRLLRPANLIHSHRLLVNSIARTVHFATGFVNHHRNSCEIISAQCHRSDILCL